MADWSTYEGAGSIDASALGSVADGVAVTTDGNWLELVSAANNKGAAGIIVCHLSSNNAAQVGALVDIGIGASGSEVVVIPDLLMGISSTSGAYLAHGYFPIQIPAGERIAVRANSQATTHTVNVGLLFIQNPGFIRPSVFNRVTAYGVDTGNTTGTRVNRAGVNVWGSWTQIEAAITNPIRGIVIAAHRSVSSWSSAHNRVRVGVGGAGSEEVVFDGYVFRTTSSEYGYPLISQFYPCSVAAGERLSVSVMSTVSNSDQDFDYIVYGID